MLSIELPVLYTRLLLVIRFKYSNVSMLIYMCSFSLMLRAFHRTKHILHTQCLSAVAAFTYIHIYAYIYFNFISLELFVVSRKTEQKVQNACPLMWPSPTRFPFNILRGCGTFVHGGRVIVDTRVDPCCRPFCGLGQMSWVCQGGAHAVAFLP